MAYLSGWRLRQQSLPSTDFPYRNTAILKQHSRYEAVLGIREKGWRIGRRYQREHCLFAGRDGDEWFKKLMVGSITLLKYTAAGRGDSERERIK